MRSIAFILMSMLFVAAFALPASAATTGLVRGSVIVDGVKTAGVDVTLQSTGYVRTTKTDTAGNFVFLEVPFGDYTISARTATIAGTSVAITVSSGEVLEVPIVLSAVKVLSRTVVNARAGAAGTPVSQNAVGHEQLVALPTNNSLDRVVQTVPGIVRFAQNEPVAHGFHGLTYEIDGAPIPQATSSEFAEIVDPKSVDSVEIFAGAMPAEFGGSRQGAVVNIVSNRVTDLATQNEGSFTAGFGNNNQALMSFDDGIRVGSGALFFNSNIQHSARGLDAPTFTPIHDANSQGDEFLRYVTQGMRNSFSVDIANQFAQYQIPINIDPNNPNDPVVSVPGTDDVQLEYDRYANLNFGFNSKDGQGSFHIIPWTRYTRVAYLGDLGNDVLAYQPDPITGLPVNLIGLQQDRRATYAGLRLSNLRSSEHHVVKFGVDLSRESFTAHQVFAQLGLPNVVEDVSAPGTQVGIYGQDKWSPSRVVSVDYGLRYDHSTGFVGGWQLSPRIGVNVAGDDRNIVHFYYGRFYAAPQLEDVRAACVALQGCPANPVYNLNPERDAYYEMGVAHTFSPSMSGYVNYFTRTAVNVLDTTQLLNTPIQAVFNNALGRAEGLELRLQARTATQDSWFASGTISHAEAAGVSGSTFLFPPSALSPAIFQPEDHDQTYEANGAFTHRFGESQRMFATLQSEYGTGYPVQFQNGAGRLPAHLTFDLSLGKEVGRGGDGSLGYNLNIDNLLNHQFIFKVANGFNTTQIASGRQVLFRVTAPF
jgi:hypothetical protein